MPAREIDSNEIATKNTEDACWITIDGRVYDVTRFADMHPGGAAILRAFGGKDASEAFWSYHRHEVLDKYHDKYFIGNVKGQTPTDVMRWDEISQVPFAEISFERGWVSPYLKDTHKNFRSAVRKFLKDEVKETAEMLEGSGKPPSRELYQKIGKFGLWACRTPPGPHMKMLCSMGLTLPGNIAGDEFDYFHEQIAHEEVSRLGTPGFIDSIGAGYVISIAPIMFFGTDAMRQNVAPSIIMGETRSCLAITEPAAGSDVAGMLTTAKKTADGKHYIVNGTKKWITNGTFCDYFVTAARTGDKPGAKGISLLLINRDEVGGEDGGFETKGIKTSYASSAGTSYIVMEDVKVPAENLIGKENRGFECIMFNFNHERWFIVAMVIAGARSIIEECFKWTNQRKVFGKALLAQPVIREKLAKMISSVEAAYAWLEATTFQMTQMDFKTQQIELGGPIALLKYQSTRVAHLVADEAVQIFGGRAITQTGMGKHIERFQRTYKFGAILGGSEEIMADLGIRQSMRSFPSNARL